MKVKNLLFVTFSLASVSLGLAFPSSSLPVSVGNGTKLSPPVVTGDSTNSTTAPATVPATVPASESEAISKIQSAILVAGGGGGGGGGAPTLPPISDKCSAGLLQILTNADLIKCLPPAALLPLLPLVTDPSIIQNFLKDPAGNYQKTIEKPAVGAAQVLCQAPKCDQKTVDFVTSTLQSACQAELTGKPPNPFIQLIFDGALFYSPIRDEICFKDGKAFCFDETTLTIIKLPQSPFNITGNALADAAAVADPEAICTKCDKDLINTVFNFIKDAKDKKNQPVLQILQALGLTDDKLTQAKVFVAVKCGLKFEDGTTP